MNLRVCIAGYTRATLVRQPLLRQGLVNSKASRSRPRCSHPTVITQPSPATITLRTMATVSRHRFKPSLNLYEPLNLCFREGVAIHKQPYQSTALLISATVPEYRGTAAGVRTLGIIRHLQHMGFRVVLATTGKVHQAIADYCAEYAAMDVDIVKIAANDSNFQDFVASLVNGRYYERFHTDSIPLSVTSLTNNNAQALGASSKADGTAFPALSMVVYDRFPLEEQFGWRVRECAPTVVTIVDTQDIYALRHTREKALAMLTAEEERSILATQTATEETREIEARRETTALVDTSTFTQTFTSPSTSSPSSSPSSSSPRVTPASSGYVSSALWVDATDATVQRELATLHRCDAALLVSEEEGRLCQRIGLQMGLPRSMGVDADEGMEVGGREKQEREEEWRATGQVGKMWYIPITFPSPHGTATLATSAAGGGGSGSSVSKANTDASLPSSLSSLSSPSSSTSSSSSTSAPVSVPAATAVASTFPSFDQRKHFVTIGTWRHPPNVDCVKFLKNTIFPKIREKFRNLGFPEHAIPELHIYGSHASAEHMQLHCKDEGFCVLGVAPTVEDTLVRYRVMLAPIRFGAGVKGKVLDAFRCGLPVAASSVAAEDLYRYSSLESDFIQRRARDSVTRARRDEKSIGAGVEEKLALDVGFGGFVCDDIDVYVDNAVRLYMDQEMWHRAQDIAQETMVERFYDQAGRKKLREVLLSVGFSAKSSPEGVAESVMGIPSSSSYDVAPEATSASSIASTYVKSKENTDIVADFVYPDATRLQSHRNRDYTGNILWMQQMRASQYMSMMLEQKQQQKRQEKKGDGSPAMNKY